MKNFSIQSLGANTFRINPKFATSLFVLLFHSATLLTPANADDAPVLESFSAINFYGDWWFFSGTVNDEDPGANTVEFGGLLDGTNVTVDSDGTFDFAIELSPGESGSVTATAYDSASQASNTLSDSVE